MLQGGRATGLTTAHFLQPGYQKSLRIPGNTTEAFLGFLVVVGYLHPAGISSLGLFLYPRQTRSAPKHD